MNKEKNAVVQCFLHELKELSKKYNLFVEGDEMMIVDNNNHIIANYLELDDCEYKAF